MTFTSNASRFGSPVITGNLDGDAYADVLVGNYDNDNVYIFSGASINGQTTIDSTDFDYLIGGSGDFGVAIDAGDVNGNGIDDILIGAYTAGKTHLFWDDVLTGSSNILSTSDAAIEYSEGGSNGRDVTIAHDINGNGLSDVLINAYGSRQVGIFSACDPQ